MVLVETEVAVQSSLLAGLSAEVEEDGKGLGDGTEEPMTTTRALYDWMPQDYLDLKRAFDGDGSQQVELRIMGQDGYWVSHIDLPPGSMQLDEETQEHYNPKLLCSTPVPYKTAVCRVGFFVDDVLKLIVNTPEVVVEEDFQVAFQPGDLTVGVSF